MKHTFFLLLNSFASLLRRTKKCLFVLFIAPLLLPSLALADWSPLIDSSMFDGPKADLVTLAGGIVTLFFIILGLVMLMRAGGR